MAKEQWTAVRVSKDTKARLEKLRDTWLEVAGAMKDELYTSHVRSGKVSTRDVCGLDQVIRRLLLLHERHAARRQRSAARRRKGGEAIAKEESRSDPSGLDQVDE